MIKKYFLASLVGASLLVSSAQALASEKIYEVKITNITAGQIFTPIFVASVKEGGYLFKYGATAEPELVRIAEGGDTSALATRLHDMGLSLDSASGSDVVLPGHTETLTVHGKSHFNRVVLGAMMLPTNDGFIGLNGVTLPKNGSLTYWLDAHDAGSETNDELFVSIPGPFGGEAFSPGDDGEGFVHVHNGIHGVGDLAPAQYDWRNPVAKVVIKRVK